MKTKISLIVIAVVIGSFLYLILRFQDAGEKQPTIDRPKESKTEPIIVATGDISCDPTEVSFNGGNGTATSCKMMAVSDVITTINPDAFLTLGDNQYSNGTLDKFQNSYDKFFGKFLSITWPSPGNHDYGTPGATGYFDYFGTAGGDRTTGYYSFVLGTWHLISLNSNCSVTGGCGKGSPQEVWLRNNLAKNEKECILAFWHHPRFSSGSHGNDTTYDAFWQALYEYGAEVVLNGHDHDYERFALQTPSGEKNELGIREFVVGTGGHSQRGFTTIQPNSEVRNSGSYGVLKMTLKEKSYDFEFIPVTGSAFTDTGTGECH